MNQGRSASGPGSIDRQALDAAWLSLVTAAERHEFGGAVAMLAHGGEIVLNRATGWAVREPEAERSPMGVDCIFDLASLTKVVATTPAVLRLVAEGRIGLDQPVGEILPEFGTDGLKAGVTIRRLMSHSAGFRDWLPVFLDATGEAAYLAAFAASQPEWEPNTRVVYSDPSFITLGVVVQRVTGDALDAYVRREIFVPLGMTDTMFRPPRAVRHRVVATEMGNAFEAAKTFDGATPYGQPWRDGLIRGEVHDGNAWYGFGGVAGHAGLFGTAHDLIRYGQMWLNCGELDGIRILPDTLVVEATTNQTRYDDPLDARGLGWRLLPSTGAPEEVPDSARGLSDQTFGHTGFTGTSLYIDPARDLVLVLLTNRVHPTVTVDYLETRARFSAAVAAAIPARVPA